MEGRIKASESLRFDLILKTVFESRDWIYDVAFRDFQVGKELCLFSLYNNQVFINSCICNS